MLDLTFNAFGIMLTVAAIYGAMNGEIAGPIGLGGAAVAVALFANFVEARLGAQVANEGRDKQITGANPRKLGAEACVVLGPWNRTMRTNGSRVIQRRESMSCCHITRN